MTEFVLKLLVSIMLATGVCLFLFAAELRFPRGPQTSLGTRWRAYLFNLTNLVAFPVAGFLVFSIPLGQAPPITASAIGLVAAAAISLLVYDFLYYWFHRAQHRLTFLWRFHSVHHSIEEMGVPTGYLHISEPFFRAALCSLPASFLVSGGYASFVVLFTVLHGHYLHSSTRLHLGRFAWIITDNHCHRIHHSTDPTHQNRNFGTTTLIWDWIFRTAYFPQKDEWPAVGAKGIREPVTFSQFLMRRSPSRTMTRWRKP